MPGAKNWTYTLRKDSTMMLSAASRVDAGRVLSKVAPVPEMTCWSSESGVPGKRTLRSF